MPPYGNDDLEKEQAECFVQSAMTDEVTSNKSLRQTNKTSEKSEFQGSVRSADGPIVKSQNENEMMKTENIDRLIGDISASYDKNRKVKPYIKRCHIYEIISAHTDARGHPSIWYPPRNRR